MAFGKHNAEEPILKFYVPKAPGADRHVTSP